MSGGKNERVIVSLQATVTYEHQQVIEVPTGLTDAELNRLLNQRYREVDGGDYGEVLSSWSPSGQTIERVAEDLELAPELRASLIDGEFVVTEIE